MTHNEQITLRNILFIDIETVSCTHSYEALDQPMQTLWQKKAANIRPNTTTSTPEISQLFSERAGIYAEFGKVIVIGLGFITFDEEDQPMLRIKALQNHDEKTLLLEFQQLLTKSFPQSNLKLCAHNGKEFDFPYLCRRMLVNSIPLPPVLNMSGKKPWEVPHIDTMELWKFGDKKHFTALDLLATLFDIPSSKTIMHGHEVNHYYYQKNELEKIAEYCKQDVAVLVQIFLKMRHWPLIPQENITLL